MKFPFVFTASIALQLAQVPALAAVLYVDVNSTNPVAPYAS